MKLEWDIINNQQMEQDTGHPQFLNIFKKALEMIKMAKSANPRLVADLFYEHVYVHFNQIIAARDIDNMIAESRKKIETQFNEISPALMIFDKYWHGLSSVNHNAIWGYLDVLCKLSAKTRN